MRQYRNMKCLFALALSCAVIFGETVKDRQGAVLGDREMMEKNSRWVYNDYEKGFRLAKELNKPVLIILRCVPCLSCAGIDASVLNEPSLQPLLDKFVCVRVMNANALDLQLFQFDYDLSLSAIFFNADKTIYGRFGSWKHQKDAFDKTTASFRAALEGALDLHRGYPANKSSLAGKQGVELPFKNPLEIPQLAGKYKSELDWQGKVVQSCVHCHMIGDAIRAQQRTTTKTISDEWIYPWPAPETIGLKLESDSVAKVESVTDGSPAARAGLKPGDEIVAANGQPLISAADLSWILHRSPAKGMVAAQLKSGREVNLDLPEGWRAKSDNSRRVGTWPMRAMAAGGLFMEDLSDEERAKRNLAKNGMALFVKHAGEYGEHAAAKKAGFRKEDVLIEVDGSAERISESALLGRLLKKHAPGSKVPVTVLRGGERIKLELPMQ